jgi:L-fuconolactonase
MPAFTSGGPKRRTGRGCRRKAHLPEPLTYEKFSAMMKEAGVEHAILVPPSWEGDRVDYSLAAAQKYPNRFAVMGRFPIEKPSERGKLETRRSRRHGVALPARTITV